MWDTLEGQEVVPKIFSYYSKKCLVAFFLQFLKLPLLLCGKISLSFQHLECLSKVSTQMQGLPRVTPEDHREGHLREAQDVACVEVGTPTWVVPPLPVLVPGPQGCVSEDDGLPGHKVIKHSAIVCLLKISTSLVKQK